MKHKLKHFIWKCLHDVLPVNEPIKRRTVKVRTNAGRTANKAIHEWSEYKEVSIGEDKTEENGEKQVAKSSRWHPPPQGFIKLNSDAVLEQKERRIGWGVVARREDGEIVGAWAGGERRDENPTVEEALAIRKAVIKAKQSGWNEDVIQSDCKQMVDKLKDMNAEDSVTGTILIDILKLSQGFDECCFSFVKRDGN
ncbi:uncharacterized protein [Coffea arabica]|uniref:RNase H type-1 domain-containing protein n=1 Tax=Coffea arabica TaxID=13443 RepID=A0A6P6W2F6_COFAR|nr:uncharacterized protein LOC113728961 [Coffea arabica]